MKITKKTILTVVEWLVTVAAYAYLVYRLVTFDQYDALFRFSGSGGMKGVICLILCILLMPVNLGLEAAKWQTLLREIRPVSLKEALLHILYGQAAAFITPYRLGDIPARVMLLNNKRHWKPAIVLGLCGGVIQTIVIIACGFVPALYFLQHTEWAYIRQVAVCAVVAILFLVVLQWKSLPQSYRLTGRQILHTFAWSGARYACWLLQFVLVMVWAGNLLSLKELVVVLPTYYLLITVTPGIPIADAGIRGSWAVFTLGLYGVAAPVAALIAIMMWLINNLLPVALYLPFRRSLRRTLSDEPTAANEE